MEELVNPLKVDKSSYKGNLNDLKTIGIYSHYTEDSNMNSPALGYNTIVLVLGIGDVKLPANRMLSQIAISSYGCFVRLKSGPETEWNKWMKYQLI